MKNKFIKILLIGIISITTINAEQYIADCRDAYGKLNKHNKRASIFIKSTDWEMANYYVEKIKDDYRYFYANECFEKVFQKQNVDKMKVKYKNNIRVIKNLTEMLAETIVEKERLEKERVLRELEEKRKMERDRLKEEIRAEMEAERSSSINHYRNGEIIDDNGDIINDKEAFMEAYLKSKTGAVRVIDSNK